MPLLLRRSGDAVLLRRLLGRPASQRTAIQPSVPRTEHTRASRPRLGSCAARVVHCCRPCWSAGTGGGAAVGGGCRRSAGGRVGRAGTGSRPAGRHLRPAVLGGQGRLQRQDRALRRPGDAGHQGRDELRQPGLARAAHGAAACHAGGARRQPHPRVLRRDRLQPVWAGAAPAADPGEGRVAAGLCGDGRRWHGEPARHAHTEPVCVAPAQWRRERRGAMRGDRH
mmetsp:Transcript_23182/g.75741  ORF Transcript_23182/g.75741 Transcript_23182/m.75741 type:complete len:225 (+) Transcript_23182:3-677(+)